MLPAGGYPPGMKLLMSFELSGSGAGGGWKGRGRWVLLGGRYSRSVPCLTIKRNRKRNKIEDLVSKK